MNRNLKQFAAGAAIATSIGIQVLMPGYVDAAVRAADLEPTVSISAESINRNSSKIELASSPEFHTNRKAYIGAGVEGLDYDKMIKWQQNVDEGRELWRIDPMQVARVEGKKYGFTEQDGFSIVKILRSSSISRYGQIEVEIIRQGKIHTMTLVKPFAQRDTIWTTYKVDGTLVYSDKSVKTKILFKTSKYKDWKFYRSEYPQDMFVTAIDNHNGRLTYNDHISKELISQFKGSKFTNKLILFANMGASSAQSDIGIEKVTISGKNMTVYVHTKSPHPDQFITMNIIYPDDYVAIDRSLIEGQGTMKITFVDQNGTIIGKDKLKIKKE
ncbi:hypothetical protein [Pelosinus propionicus]|uniref:PrcB C-terminal domain-containing protein n=1 Tax=Pelosinus propionicus DSM 13327 TaxID=1123291 RepID=A0A1I4GZS9_9FIRM|nr:hypothetical protein [Pelosinus propionicus]SFL35479.1 hypothetical protein SAMN04490355_100268 [Pelosinus propionicus DSM 13327]